MTLAQEPTTTTPKTRKPYYGLAIAGFTVALAGLVLGLIPILFIFAWVLGATALTFSIIGRKHGLGKAGIVLSIAAIVLGCVGLGIVVNATNKLSDDLNSLSSSVATAPVVPAAPDTSGATP